MSPQAGVARLSGPLYLVLTALTYGLGAGLARYLGFPLRADALILGLATALLLQASMSWLAAAFRPERERHLEAASLLERTQIARAALYLAIAALAFAGALTFAMFRFQAVPVAAILCLGLSVLVIMVYALPPMVAADRGFGELLVAVQIAYLFPTLGFLLQADGLHRLLNLCTVALTLLLLATLIALEMPAYGGDVLRERSTILTRMGWERALIAHHVLLATGYVLLALALALGFSFRLIGPAFLTLPFALLQVLLLRGLSQGAKPIWNLLRANALAIFALTAYFLMLSFWLR